MRIFHCPVYRCCAKLALDVKSISEDKPSISDASVMEIAIRENRTILTFDRDYGELVFRRGHRPPAGVVYLRIQHFQPDYPGILLLDLINKQGLTFEGQFTVIDEAAIRQRSI
ncbi:MAG: DUF5615 family PIN-like protein [Saprospiraceae bacterium]|nr:DUF5615 family PIN-like protein [Saprospiraceae bacterium]